MTVRQASPATEAKYQRLVASLQPLGSALVAFSGGVDSALLLRAAQEALGARCLAVSARSPSIPQSEQQAAEALAAALGARWLAVTTNELADPVYRANPPERCYHCKRILFARFGQLAAAEGLAAVLEGSNLDDLGDYRPGRRALAELGVRSPLIEAGLSKAEVRELARSRGLSVWDKPAQACLASRVPYGSPLSAERLQRIEAAEQALRGLGLAQGQLRVRDHGELARIEVEPGALAQLVAAPRRGQLLAALKGLGYRYVALDLEGYRTGALNEGLETAVESAAGGEQGKLPAGESLKGRTASPAGSQEKR